MALFVIAGQLGVCVFNCSRKRRLSQVTVEFIVVNKTLTIGRNEKLRNVEHFHSHWVRRKQKSCVAKDMFIGSWLSHLSCHENVRLILPPEWWKFL